MRDIPVMLNGYKLTVVEPPSCPTVGYRSNRSRASSATAGRASPNSSIGSRSGPSSTMAPW